MLKQLKAISIVLSTFAIACLTHLNQASAQQVEQIQWDTKASNMSGQLDRDFTFLCPSNGSVNTVWGTDLYTDDSSICTAAVHSGLINVRDGGEVTIRIRPGANVYNSSNRNNISNTSYGGWGGSFVFVDANRQATSQSTPQSTSQDRQIELIEWGTSASNHRTRLDREFTFICPQNVALGNVWGTGLYTDDSSICTAAIHSGIISKKRGGRVTIVIRPGSNNYRGTSRNGVRTGDYGAYDGSFSFVRKRN